MPINFQRVWGMPNKNTYQIPAVNKLISKYYRQEYESADPFANINRICKYTNDLDPEYKCEYNMDALDFLKQFKSESLDFILFDPPYSPTQVKACYNKLNKTADLASTSASYWSNLKNEIARILKPGSIVISFGWNTNGIGKQHEFEIIEILLVYHGAQHNDTICTVEKKFNSTLF